ncbi:MAG: hypothetical protein MUE88_01625 [Flavobacteriales bacterium]|nr:hypothetical protein [Flavobacteriales bacterium]
MRSPLPFRPMLVCATLFTAGVAQAQPSNEHALPVGGRIVDVNGRLDACSITVYRDDGHSEAAVQQKNGRFDVELLHDHQYTLEFSKDGYITKRIVVDTRAKVEPAELALMPLDMDVMMLKTDQYEGADTDQLDMPFAIVRYDKQLHAFVQDMEYTAAMQRTNGALLLQAGRARK